MIFYSDGKPQLPNYYELTMPTPSKVTTLLGNSVSIKDRGNVDISKVVNFTDARLGGGVHNRYVDKLYEMIVNTDKEDLIQFIETVKGKTLSETEKEEIKKYSISSVNKRSFRNALDDIIWPMDQVYRFDQYKYDASVSAANKLKPHVKQIYSIATFPGIEKEYMHNPGDPGALTVQYNPKNYYGASRMMQLISSSYDPIAGESSMGIKIQPGNTYTDGTDYEGTFPGGVKKVEVDYLPTGATVEERKPLWITSAGDYIVDGSETRGDKLVNLLTPNFTYFTHYYDVLTTPNKNPGNFYTNAVTVERLYQAIVGNISNIVDGNVVTDATIDDSSIIIDYLSDNFVLPEGFTQEDVEVYISNCTGKNEESGAYTWAKEEKYEEVMPPYVRPQVSVVNDTVKVEGFSFQENIVTEKPRLITDVDENIVEDYGRKIVIKFKAKAKSDEVWGNHVKTNKPDSGIYIPNTPIITFPEPTVDIYRNYEMKDNVVYLGNKIGGYHTLSEQEAKMVDGKRNHNVNIQYILSNGGEKYNYRVPAGKKLSEGTLYEGTGSTTKCELGSFLENTEYTSTRTIFKESGWSEGDKLDIRGAVDQDTVDKKDTTTAHVAILKPILPTVDIWIDNPASKDFKPSLQTACFGTTTGETDNLIFQDMTAESIKWEGIDYLNQKHTQGTKDVSKVPSVEVIDNYLDFSNREYSENDFNIQLLEDDEKTVLLEGATLEADTTYNAFPNFKVHYNTYNVEIKKEVKDEDLSDNMSFMFDAEVIAASDSSKIDTYNILLRHPEFKKQSAINTASRTITGLECTEDVFAVEEDTTWSWMYQLDDTDQTDNLPSINNSLEDVKHTFTTSNNNRYKGTVSFEAITYNKQKVPTVTFIYKNSLKNNTGLYHQHSVKNVFEEDGIVTE